MTIVCVFCKTEYERRNVQKYGEPVCLDCGVCEACEYIDETNINKLCEPCRDAYISNGEIEYE